MKNKIIREMVGVCKVVDKIINKAQEIVWPNKRNE